MPNKKAIKLKEAEYVSEDILEDEFVNMFSKFLLVQKIMGVNRVDARDRFVTAPSPWQKLYTIIQAIVAIATFSIFYYKYYQEHFVALSKLQGVVLSIYWAIIINYICSVLHVRFANNNANSMFFIKMQKIDRLFGIDKKTINNMHRNATNLLVVFIIVTTLLMIALISYNSGWITTMAFIGSIWCLSASILESNYCLNLLIYFIIRIRYINCILLNHLEGKSGEQKPRILAFPLRNVLRFLVAQTRDYQDTEVDVYLKTLFECFASFRDLYQFPIAILFFSQLSIALTTVRFTARYMLNNDFSYQEWLMIPTYVLGSLMQTLSLVVGFEQFSREVKYTRRLTVAIMSRCPDDGSLREKAKRMFSTIDMSPPRFSVYDMWHVNAAFFISFINVIAYLTITQLQFILL